jgi:hypothetical protein
VVSSGAVLSQRAFFRGLCGSPTSDLAVLQLAREDLVPLIPLLRREVPTTDCRRLWFREEAVVQRGDARTSDGEEETGQRLVHRLHLTESILGESRERGARWHTASVLSFLPLLFLNETDRSCMLASSQIWLCYVASVADEAEAFKPRRPSGALPVRCQSFIFVIYLFMYACVLFREKNRSSNVLDTQKNRLSVKPPVSRRSKLFLLRHCQCPNLSLKLLLLCFFCFGRVCEEQGIDARHDGPKRTGFR